METAPREAGRASVVGASLWMVGLTLLLFWLPAINGLIGGLVGGYKARGVGRALSAAVLPAIVVAVGSWLLLVAFDTGFLGFLAGATAGLIVLVSEVSLLLGAAVGGFLGRGRRLARSHA